MNVLVTGANGFIGQSLCPVLTENGFVVRAALRTKEKYHVLRGVNDVCTVGDINEQTDWGEALVGINAVVHLAARVHVSQERRRDRLEDFRKVNAEGTARLATMATSAGIARFIYLSTVKVIGEQSGSAPFTEIDTPSPRDPYAISKWEAEQNLFQISKSTGMAGVVLRPPLVYGPGVRANFLRLMQIVDRGIPLPLRSNDNRRSMLFIGNLTDMIAICVSHPLAAGETFFVADYENVSTTQLIKLLAVALGREPRLFSCPLSFLRIAGRMTGMKEDIERLTSSLVVNCEKAKNTLGWTPPISLVEGIAETVKWYKSQ